MSENLSYEDAIKKLNEINEKLSAQNITLEQASKLFEDGANLIKICYDHIKVVKGKMLTIKKTIDGLKMEEEE